MEAWGLGVGLPTRECCPWWAPPGRSGSRQWTHRCRHPWDGTSAVRREGPTDAPRMGPMAQRPASTAGDCFCAPNAPRAPQWHRVSSKTKQTGGKVHTPTVFSEGRGKKKIENHGRCGEKETKHCWRAFHLVPTNCLLVSAFFPCRCKGLYFSN